MKKICIILSCAMLALTLASCKGTAASAPKESTTTTTSTQSQASALSGKVATGGSTSMEKVILALSEAYMQANPGVTVTYDATGSGAGITGALDGVIDLGLSSRALKAEETGLTATSLALDGIAIVVNKDNKVTDLTIEQIKKIATGEIKNWKELGGSDMEIVFLGREAGSGTRDGFESIVGVKDKCVYAEELTATGAVIGKVQANAGGIGYASLASVDEKVKAVTVDGVVASEATVLDGTYKIQRPFILVTKTDKEQSAAVKSFIEFATGSDAKEIISNAGAVPPVK
ncbi:MAG: phosphate ABC transporter substrate-binding protein [Oscillospiraceae bacterium]